MARFRNAETSKKRSIVEFLPTWQEEARNGSKCGGKDKPVTSYFQSAKDTPDHSDVAMVIVEISSGC